VEGATREDGRGESVWDMFARKEGAIWQGQNADVACDHYHRYREDVALMKQIGVKAYRLSVAWPRVLPGGTGAVNPKGLAFYDRLVDELLDAGIAPYITLFHWDFPLPLYHRGGWLNRDSADWFADYTRVVVDRLSDRVQHWMTLNEPQVYIGNGHHSGVHAPGDKLAFAEVLRAGHNTLRAHGKAVQAIRAHAKAKPEVGFAFVGVVFVPASDLPADVEAARISMAQVKPMETWNNAWWMDPVLLGSYPEEGVRLYGADMPAIQPGDLETMRQPLDFLGANIYHGQVVKAGADGKPEVLPYPQGHALNLMYWPVVPESLYWGPRFLHERYQLPIVVTENGCPNPDWVHEDGKVHDSQRIDYTSRYLKAYARAGRDGVPIRGYFHWSIMDNFEWGEGYKQRLGLIHVDYLTQKRTLKDSALWYRDVIAANGAGLS